MSCERALNFDHWKTFSKNSKLLRAWLRLVYNLPRIVKFTDFSLSSLKLKRGILPLLTKYVSWLENYLLYQAKVFLVNLTPKELTPCKISQISHCAFNVFQFYYMKHIYKSAIKVCWIAINLSKKHLPLLYKCCCFTWHCYSTNTIWLEIRFGDLTWRNWLKRV